MSTNGTCIEPNYVVPGANPCIGTDSNPSNLPPLPPTDLQTSAPGATTWSVSFNFGLYSTGDTCYVTLPNGTGLINGTAVGNIASVAGLTPGIAYLFYVRSINIFGFADSVGFPFTTGILPTAPTVNAMTYSDVNVTQISYTPGTGATSYTATCSIPSNPIVNGVATTTPNYFSFNGLYNDSPAGSPPVQATVIVTATNLFGSASSAPVIINPVQIADGLYTRFNNFPGPPYGIVLSGTLPSDIDPNNNPQFANVNQAFGAGKVMDLYVNVTPATPAGQYSGNMVWSFVVGQSANWNNDFYGGLLVQGFKGWTYSGDLRPGIGTSQGIIAGGSYTFVIGVEGGYNTTTWLPGAYYDLYLRYNRRVGTLTP